MAQIQVDFGKRLGVIKPVHGVGQPPMVGIDCSMFRYLKEANIPFSRLHDVGGRFGGNLFADIPNLFPDFNADPEDPASYAFEFTDLMINALMEAGCEPFFRLGVTIENYCEIRPFRIFPPADYHKWAKVCEMVIRHYNEGWCNGYHYDIRYWEIWNEPDNYEEIDKNQMWHGTKEQYYELYGVASKHLKGCFPELKIGGYASCGFYAIRDSVIWNANSSPRLEYFIEFFDGFLDYVKANRCPLDFFSWHSYGNVEETADYAAYARKRLDEAGFEGLETSCNEWNYEAFKGGTPLHTSNNTAMLIVFQHSPVDTAMFYDARCGIGAYGGLFHPMKKEPYPLYYGFKAFGELYRLGTEVFSASDDGQVFTLAAVGDGGKGGILVANIGADKPLQLEIAGQTVKSVRVIAGDKVFAECPMPEVLAADGVWFIETEA